MPLQPHQQRVLDEKTELDGRLESLGKFISGAVYPTLPIEERMRLKAQERAMKEYSDILEARILAFP